MALNILCVTTDFKGGDFLKGCKEAGNNVYLLTKKSLENKDWPWDYIDDVFYIDEWKDEDVRSGLAYKFRTIKFDRFIALDDFDVEKVADLREQFRVPGMGNSTVRFFRDKLAMRLKAYESGIKVPAFISTLNDLEIKQYTQKVNAPWLIKPRLEASATGITKIHNNEELWEILGKLNDQRHNYLIEKYAPGVVYHVDSLSINNKIIFARASRYLETPLNVAQGGGIFRSMVLDTKTIESQRLIGANQDVLRAFGMKDGASHTEFIISKDTNEVFFLETSSRVGGANLAEMVEFASGINLWREWAFIETAKGMEAKYKLPKQKKLSSGIVVSLSRYEQPDTAVFNDPEIVWRLDKKWHVGFIVQSKSEKRVRELLDKYTKIIATEFHATLPEPDVREH